MFGQSNELLAGHLRSFQIFLMPLNVSASVANDGDNQVFISKYCNASSLDRYIRRKLVLSEWDTAEFVRQIAEQLSMLHSERMYNGDLVPANIFVHIDGPKEIKYRICGLGHLTQK